MHHASHPSHQPQLPLLLALAACDQELSRIREQRQALDAELLPLTTRLERTRASLAYERSLLERTEAELAAPAARSRTNQRQRTASVEQFREADLHRLGEIARALREQKQLAAAAANHRVALRSRAAHTRRRIAAHRREAHTLTRQIEAARSILEAARSELRARAEEIRRRRAELITRLDTDMVERYERPVAQQRLAMVEDGVCSSCHVAVPRGAAAALAGDIEVLECPGCGQLLYAPARTDH